MKQLGCFILTAFCSFGIVLSSCSSFSVKSLEKFSVKCKAEQMLSEPERKRTINLSTKQRRRQQREIEKFKKQRIALYKSLYNYSELYRIISENEGNCTQRECIKLERYRQHIIECCPETAKVLPVIEYHP